MKHVVATYALGLLALGVGAAGFAVNREAISELPAAVEASPLDWPALTDPQLADLVGQLSGSAVPEADRAKPIEILCLPTSCSLLAQDFQYAAYQAGFDTTSNIPVMGNPVGITISPADTGSEAIAAAISSATGYPVQVLDSPVVTQGYTLAVGTRDIGQAVPVSSGSPDEPTSRPSASLAELMEAAGGVSSTTP